MVLIFDLGATNVRMALADKGGIHEIVRAETDPSPAGFSRFLGMMESLINGQNIKAIAGGMAGQLRGEDGELKVSTNLPGWIGLPVLRRMRELLDCPIFIANDVEMCGLGEAYDGAGTDEGVMAYYTVSTGVNATRIVDGEIDQTVSRYELGKQIISEEDGRAVELESLTGGAALEKRLGKHPRDIKDRKVWLSIEKHLASGLYNTTLYWNPQTIVVGGSMIRDIDLAHVAELMSKLPTVFDEPPKLVKATLGDEAGLRGAWARLEQLGYR